MRFTSHPSPGRVPRLLALAAAAAIGGLSHAQVHEQTVAHILRRTSFGPRPGEVEQYSQTIPDDIVNHLAVQLTTGYPESSEYQTGLAAFGIPNDENDPLGFPWDIRGLAKREVYRSIFSANQLVELMVMFWQQNLSTSYNPANAYFKKHAASLDASWGSTPNEKAANAGAYVMFLENASFREHAVGSFRELLFASGKGPAMLIYLDSVINKVTNPALTPPNENYARELLELHTNGVSPYHGLGYFYSQIDVQLLSFAFSGWDVEEYDVAGHKSFRFKFDAPNHYDLDTSSSSNQVPFQLHSVSAGQGSPFAWNGELGEAQGDAILEYLATCWETRYFVCRKLIEFFVGYAPHDPSDPIYTQLPAGTDPIRRLTLPGTPAQQAAFEDQLDLLLAQCVLAWTTGGVDGNIGAVLTTIFVSDAFNAEWCRFARIKSPLEVMSSAARALDADLASPAEMDHMMDILELDLYQEPFRFPSPDGFPIDSLDLMSSNSGVHRINFGQSIPRNTVHPDPTGVLGGNAAGTLDWYPLRLFLPQLLTGPWLTRYQNFENYLRNYPPAAGTPDIGNTTEVIDRLLHVLFHGLVSSQSRTLMNSYMTTLEAQQGTTLTQICTNANPNNFPSTWPSIFQPWGVVITRFFAYAVSLPQFQLK